ncbi:hypothetical protein BJ170DRAFT_688383 [Xylariales sp. AK1849]|nr:hypothetical protein BJ170DRAFT_688383 [Xylariales sp. AK1849]
MDAAAAKHVGARILGEIEEESLEELITAFRTSILPHPPNHPSHPPFLPSIPIPRLTTLIAKHHHAIQSAPPPLLSLSGRYLPFLYHLVSTLIAVPHCYAIVIIDCDWKFDVTRLVNSSTTNRTKDTGQPGAVGGEESPKSDYPAQVPDLKHVYIYRPARSSPPAQQQTAASVAHAQSHLLYGAHASRDRVWWGTIVVGGRGGHVNAGWKGWMDVQRREVAGFGVGLSVEEALLERQKREESVRGRGWEARCRWGTYSFGEEGGAG